ncbi:hypothetical protein [Pseudomonas sp. MWU16-30317]|uniref:hypothetical protein n=1 Tax=Pseudomonas sp. MWU16-30317 TaxID=2878095 RepID=UPI001CFBA16C|nr:hypothetical protein [Pseudomonas sp. MWU16-30317]
MEQQKAAQKEADQKAQYDAECLRVKTRREHLSLPAYSPDSGVARPWGLALSGGGIRSATFCLGVLQALARARRTDQPDDPPVLARFDYLSTVSGGGYIGSFFSSLFLPNRLRGTATGQPSQSPADAARDAYKVFEYEPPGKMSTGVDYASTDVGKGPGAWLRENGRYLTPTGGGDMFYALAMAWRNWLSLQLVIGMPVVLGLTLLFLAQIGFAINLFILPVVALGIIVLPCALAYWLIVPDQGLGTPPNRANPAFRSAIAVAATLLLLGVVCLRIGYSPRAAWLSLYGAMVTGGGLTVTSWVVSKLRTHQGGNTVRNYRVQVTRYLSRAIILLVGTLMLASMAGLAQQAYGYLFSPFGAAGVGIVPVLMWLVRRLALLRDEKALPGWLAKLPLDTLALVGATLVGMLVCLTWALWVLWVANDGANQALTADANPRLYVLGLLALVLTVVASRFVGFLNTSSLNTFYASRLVRAYLGASNGRRFGGASRAKQLCVAEPLTDDDIDLETFYGTPTAGPLHLINVTMNLTVDPGEQLVQRDRKGKPLCLAPFDWTAPGKRSTSFILDGVSYRRDLAPGQRSEIMLPLTLGQWIGTSGAAFSTGLGRATSLGFSLALGLANVRLGVWWPSRFLDPGDDGPYQRRDRSWARRFPTQSYLFYEFTAHFHGHRRDFQYLSDGGHFENTATYELLRRERDIELIVVCDCGCDPTYRFDDLANLVRLARIDQRLEIRQNAAVLNDPVLGEVFGSIEYFQQPFVNGSKKCALLFDVFDTADQGDAPTPRCRILVLKPRLISALSADVVNYALVNEAFPNQSTIDQFFDEAQFESYRQLGLSIGCTLFGDKRTSPVSSALWRYLNLS